MEALFLLYWEVNKPPFFFFLEGNTFFIFWGYFLYKHSGKIRQEQRLLVTLHARKGEAGRKPCKDAIQQNFWQALHHCLLKFFTEEVVYEFSQHLFSIPRNPAVLTSSPNALATVSSFSPIAWSNLCKGTVWYSGRYADSPNIIGLYCNRSQEILHTPRKNCKWVFLSSYVNVICFRSTFLIGMGNNAFTPWMITCYVPKNLLINFNNSATLDTAAAVRNTTC